MMTISNLKGYLFKIYWIEIQKWALFVIVVVCKKANSYTGILFYDDIFQSERLLLKSTGLRSKNGRCLYLSLFVKKG